MSKLSVDLSVTSRFSRRNGVVFCLLGAVVLSSCGGTSEATGDGAKPVESSEALSASTSTSVLDGSSVSILVGPSASVIPVTEPERPTTPYLVPLEEPKVAGWGTTHSTYPATDIFATCGAVIVSPVNGSLLEVRTVDSWDSAVDNPATRGGRSIAILGDDGVRYYMAHLDLIEPNLVPGGRVTAGERLGTMGTTGRSSACHLHFALSPPCPGPEWSVRRGVIWPYPYLDAWRRGEALSPVDEIDSWLAENPDACALAMADPNAPDS